MSSTKVHVMLQRESAKAKMNLTAPLRSVLQNELNRLEMLSGHLYIRREVDQFLNRSS